MTDKNAIKNFEEWNESYVKKYSSESHYASPSFIVRYIEGKRIKEVARLINAQAADNLIELGCGEGHILEKLGQSKITGVDLSETSLKKAAERMKRAGKPARFVKANVEELPLEITGEKFNKIICSEVIEHVQRPEKVIGEISKIASPNADIVISAPNERLINRLKSVFIKLRLFSLLFPGVSLKMDDEWHLNTFSLALLKKYTEGKLKIKKVRAIPFWFCPLYYIVVFELCLCEK
ncbi:MAG: class I SAM-dependent methyltransferase [Patescibacteria group bacterium]